MTRRLPDAGFWHGKRVFITGHTGFKGGWLSLWLHRLGATLAGYALAPPTAPSFFASCGIADLLEHQLANIRDHPRLAQAISEFQPDIVIHLAAQPLVRASYANPIETFATNVMGTANLLDAVGRIAGAAVTLVITSDKVYAESPNRHSETDRLSGVDPYSASKASAELVVAGFPLPVGHAAATLRSGNVIGGGDWSPDRLVPDLIQARLAGMTPVLRNPDFIRPWQHVLDPLCGYLLAAESLWVNRSAGLTSWNLGPTAENEVTVGEIARRLFLLWGGDTGCIISASADAPHEAEILRLDSTKARIELGWRPRWNLDQALSATVGWFKNFQAGANMAAFSSAQITTYESE